MRRTLRNSKGQWAGSTGVGKQPPASAPRRFLQSIREAMRKPAPSIDTIYRKFLESVSETSWAAATIDIPLDLDKLSLGSPDALLEIEVDHDMLPEPNSPIFNDGQREIIKAMLRAQCVKEVRAKDGSSGYSHYLVPATSPFVVQGVSGDGSQDRMVRLAISSSFESGKPSVHRIGYLDADGVFGFVLFDPKFAWESLENTVVSRVTRGELEDIEWKVLIDTDGSPTALYAKASSGWYPSDMA